jgi:hypothetical protein
MRWKISRIYRNFEKTLENSERIEKIVRNHTKHKVFLSKWVEYLLKICSHLEMSLVPILFRRPMCYEKGWSGRNILHDSSWSHWCLDTRTDRKVWIYTERSNSAYATIQNYQNKLENRLKQTHLLRTDEITYKIRLWKT